MNEQENRVPVPDPSTLRAKRARPGLDYGFIIGAHPRVGNGQIFQSVAGSFGMYP